MKSAWLNKIKKRHHLKLEITCIVIFKAILITILWYIFFSKPLDQHLNNAQMQNHFYGNVTNQTNNVNKHSIAEIKS